MHRVMGVDIETYSSVDLTEAGVYAYVDLQSTMVRLRRCQQIKKNIIISRFTIHYGEIKTTQLH